MTHRYRRGAKSVAMRQHNKFLRGLKRRRRKSHTRVLHWR